MLRINCGWLSPLTCFLRGLIGVWIFLVPLVSAVSAQQQAARNASQQPRQSLLRVMSVNIRNGVADDGPNHWQQRKQLLLELLRGSGADLIGTQETYPFQAEYLQEHLDGYEYWGRSRDDANGEQCGVFWRKERFRPLRRGNFWLSETPDQPGSKSWDSSLPRMATWVQLEDQSNQQQFYWINTHFDHRGNIARHESAKLIRQYVDEYVTMAPVIVTGDFNAPEGSLPYSALVDQPPANRLRDTYRLVHPSKSPNEGTFNGFHGRTEGPRIDWILVSSAFQVHDAAIVRFSENGRYPSDHFPVTAQISLEP